VIAKVKAAVNKTKNMNRIILEVLEDSNLFQVCEMLVSD
jgi:hypothetical protein